MELKDKAVEIKGKKYVLVSDRVLDFNANYPSGKIETVLLSDSVADMVVCRAVVTPNVKEQDRFFTGHSQATWGDGYINKTSAMENAETSAVGRALGFMGIGVIDSIASADELHKATTQPERKQVDDVEETLSPDEIKKFNATVSELSKKIPPAEYEAFVKKFYTIFEIKPEDITERRDAEIYYKRLKQFVDEYQKLVING